MIDAAPVILIASASRHEGRLVERKVAEAGWSLVRVADADAAARQLDGDGRRAVLLIDAGLLAMTHDPQWRDLRAHHPDLATVVRCLTPRPEPRRCANGHVLEVHPDDVVGMRRAVRSLCPSRPGAGSARPAAQPGMGPSGGSR